MAGGWSQVGCFGCTAAFAAAAPQMVRYRLTSAMDADTFGTEAWLGPSEESRCLYAAYGWEYVAKRGPFYIYRTRDPAAREVDTDPHTQALVLRSLHRRGAGELAHPGSALFPGLSPDAELVGDIAYFVAARSRCLPALPDPVSVDNGVLPGSGPPLPLPVPGSWRPGRAWTTGSPASPGPPVSAGQRPAPGAAGGLPGSRRVAQAGLMRDYSSRLIFWMAFFSRREIWAWEIPIRAETSIWVFPSKKRRRRMCFSRR